MKEIYGDAWKLFESGEYFILFITTNGTIKSDGSAVMGRGIAAECANRYPNSPITLGKWLTERGNRWCIMELEEYGMVCSFPVKYNWWDKASMTLIKESCTRISNFYRLSPDSQDMKFLLPRPGCGYGQLKWQDVKKEIEPLLDDRFYIVHFKEDNT